MNIKTITLEIRRTGTISWAVRNREYVLHYHNNYGPAIEYADGTKEWRVNDFLHRLDGPAVEWDDGSKSWYINHIKYNTELEYWIAIQEYPHEYKDNNT